MRKQAEHILDVYKSKQGFVTAWDEKNQMAYAQRRSWEGVEVETLLAGRMLHKRPIGMSFCNKPNV